MFTLLLPSYLIANGGAMWGNYILTCLWIEINAPCALFASAGYRIQRQSCFCSTGKDNTGIALRHRRPSERSQHNFQAGRNMPVEHAWGGRLLNRREHLYKHCQSKWLITSAGVLRKVNLALKPPSIPQPLNAGPQTFRRLSLGCSKCIIIKIPPVVGLHCNF